MGLQDKARQIMVPIAPKSEGEIADAVETWLEGLRIISKHKDYDMSYRLRVKALKMLMIGRTRDQFELWEEECREDTDDTWKDLLMKVQGYASRRRLEANYAKNKGDPMELTEVNDNWGTQEKWSEYGNIDALGKSKGKGFKGKG